MSLALWAANPSAMRRNGSSSMGITPSRTMAFIRWGLPWARFQATGVPVSENSEESRSQKNSSVRAIWISGSCMTLPWEPR